MNALPAAIQVLAEFLIWLGAGMVFLGLARFIWVLGRGCTSSGRRVIDVLRDRRPEASEATEALHTEKEPRRSHEWMDRL